MGVDEWLFYVNAGNDKIKGAQKCQIENDSILDASQELLKKKKKRNKKKKDSETPSAFEFEPVRYNLLKIIY